MINKKNRSGTSQADLLLAALDPGYVSVEERSITDLIKYARQYARGVQFYKETNEPDGFWDLLFDFTDNQILELAEFAENPDLFKEDTERFEKYSKPHLAVFLTFLKLLKYPRDKFAALTDRNIAFFYRQILKLEERKEVPDEVHVIFKLARDVRERLLKKGTLLNAGKDETGVDVHYEVNEDIVLNKAQVSDIKTIHFTKISTDIKDIHLSYDRGDIGFEKILCLVLGSSSLPPYRATFGQTIAVDAQYLRTELYARIKGKEKDELAESDADYIFNSLCFRFLKDFWYCLDLLYREINHGYVGITYPEDWEWENAYTILEAVYLERLARERRLELKEIHKTKGFEGVMEYAFGEPNPGDMLYKMPDSISTLVDLANANNEAARKYIENKLCMSPAEFQVIMAKQEAALSGGMAGDEVYSILEAAWTQKRGYRYPELSLEKVAGYQTNTIFSADTDQEISRFQAFGKSVRSESSETMNLGFAVSSPVLNLHEGNRKIELVISCREGTVDTEKISELFTQNRDFFTIWLSVGAGWQQVDMVSYEAGEFIIKPGLKTFSRENSFLVCDVLQYPLFDRNCINKFLLFSNGKVYQVKEYDDNTSKIHLLAVNLSYPTGSVRIINQLIPKKFVGELPAEAELDISEYATTVKTETETFDDYYQGRYLVDQKGKIFFIQKFIDSQTIEVSYCGVIEADPSGDFSETQRLFLRKVWETIEPEYAENEGKNEINGLAISQIYSAEKEFYFQVTDGALKISYPEGATAGQLISAWEAWKDNPLHQPGRYEIKATGQATWRLAPVAQTIEKTGEIIKRYESLSERGIQVTYRGRPVDAANLVITEPDAGTAGAGFLISNNTLTVIPGRVSRTANQIAANWRSWVANNDPQGFAVESKDNHFWEAAPLQETELTRVDKQWKKCEICDLYGVGIRVWYTGLISDQPKLILQENIIDLYEFEIQGGQNFTIKYPSLTDTSVSDLMEAWEEWKASGLNDPGNFELEQLGDGAWTIQAKTERELLSAENRIIECTINEIDVVARYQLSGEYQNAMLEFIKDPEATDFSFSFSDDSQELKTRKLTIYYPPLNIPGSSNVPGFPGGSAIELAYRSQQVQALLFKWNREYHKNGFSLLRAKDDAKWNSDPPTYDFKVNLNYVRTIDPNGFIVKYCPVKVAGVSISELPKANVVINENTGNTFGFNLLYDYQNKRKILYIKYPTDRKNRNVAALLKAWKNEAGSLLETNSKHWEADEHNIRTGELKEFDLQQAGTGKWEIAGITERELAPGVTSATEFSQEYYEYKTSDVSGFTVEYTGPEGVIPSVAIDENETNPEIFNIWVDIVSDVAHGVEVGGILNIQYPKRADKRRIVDLFVAWNHYKQIQAGLGNPFLGFEISDTSAVIEKRSSSGLLPTGDLVREYQAGARNGICISYLGDRGDPEIEIESLLDFTNADVGKKILWANGDVYTIAEKLDKNTVVIEPDVGNIPYFNAIKLYEEDAICFDALKFTIYLDGDFPRVVSFPAGNLAAAPLVKILFNNATVSAPGEREEFFYEYFKGVQIRRIDIKVTVAGLKNIKMRSDLAIINPSNSFNPFGLTPDAPARLYFANPEICEKKLDSLDINLTWADGKWTNAEGLPDLGKYYDTYSRFGLDRPGTIKNEDFEVKLEFLDRRIWVSISREAQTIFQKTLSYDDFDRQTYQGALFLDGQDLPRDPLEWPRYYKMELFNRGFMKELYQELVSESVRAANNIAVAQSVYDTIKQEIRARAEQIKAAKITEAEAREKGDPYYLPVIPEARELPVLPENERDLSRLTVNAPYTPALRALSIDYTASARILPEAAPGVASSTEIPVQFFRFHPFGFEEAGQPDVSGAVPGEAVFLLPQYDQEGYLFIGFKNLEPSQSVSLLFQMVSGSGAANLPMPDIRWSYLAANRWISFKESEILKDQTYGLQDTGIIRFNIPPEVTDSNTILPGNRRWICATAQDNITAVPDILDIKAGAVCVTYLNRNNSPGHLAGPLAAGSIKELTERDPAIREVNQPYTSFNGKQQEEGLEFYIRISQRLKHKNRALTLGDYEKMILTQFPQVYKVKCVPQDERGLMGSDLLTPEFRGEIVIIVILKNSNAVPFFPLKPKTPANILTEIERYVQSYMPPLVTVTVRNPRFEEIKYRLAVKFNRGLDRGFYINQLNEDIKRFLSPWAYDSHEELSFGSSVYSAKVINYLEKTDYVDYVANFCLLQQIIQHENFTEVIPLFLTEDNAATAKYPDSILVSAESHIIDVITTDLYDAGAFSGIGYMQIGTDFWISRPGPVFTVGIGEMEIEAWPVLRYAFAAIPVTVKVRGKVHNTEYEIDNVTAQLSREDSQKIWDILKDAGLLEQEGNVIPKIDFYADNPTLTLKNGQSFETYIGNNSPGFSCKINLNAHDFDPSAGAKDPFSYIILELHNSETVKNAVVEILKTALSFDGRSQYPFIVY